ncbi:MAG: hypothetical protein OXC37_02330 [Bdellovibrionaceae bacterium]|nr:hypothetical protein [Pseudobdellovibrionaceae bacterium]
MIVKAKNTLVVIIAIFLMYPVLGDICYDVTTDYKCRQNNNPSPEKKTFKNELLKSGYEIQQTTDSISLRLNCGKGSGSERNIMDLHHVIEKMQLSHNEKFICKMEGTIRSYMQTILNDRQFMKDYLKRKKTNKPIDKKDKIRMTALLIKYRLFKNQKGICNGYVTGDNGCYFSSARFDVPIEALRRIQLAAREYIQQDTEPKTCLVNGKEYSINSPECENEILSRVQTIPIPLILAQAVQESGWGNNDNKWVADYNNYLGLQVQFNNPKTMPCYKNCRCAGTNKTRCALRFQKPVGSVYEYAIRFNASPLKMYKEFREQRQKLGEISPLYDIHGQCNNARSLVSQLKRYAEEPEYVSFICDTLNDKVCEMLKKCPSYKRNYL